MAWRQVVAVANDITHNSGAFGPREDAVFRAATELALAERLPLVYLAANSGARVGLAAEVKACLQACAASLWLPAPCFLSLRGSGCCAVPCSQFAGRDGLPMWWAREADSAGACLCTGRVDEPCRSVQGLPVHVPV